MTSKRKRRHPLKRILIDIAGFGLIVVGIIIMPVPGPGGIPVIALGLGILTLNYEWAEKFLKDFDHKRAEMTEQYLNPDPPIAWLLDITGICIILAGLWLLLGQNISWLQGLGISWMFAGILLLTSNQRRTDRTIAWLKKHFGKHK